MIKNDLSILVLGHTRPTYIADVLESLNRQGAITNVDVWLDGHQGIPDLKYKTDLVREVVDKYDVRSVFANNGAIGFRKLILHALDYAVTNYRFIMILEDDCFPTKDAVSVFMDELASVEKNDDVFSVYGHHFLVPGERETCTRFQGWGWATTAGKLHSHLENLIYLYSLRESQYLDYVESKLDADVLRKLDITPPRQPSDILKSFFAWDETLALLTALSNQVHQKTPVRTIYNFGASEDSSRFKRVDWYMQPPFNMVSHESIWDYF